MPSSMTHTYFGLDVYNKLPQKYQKKIENKLEHYKLFCQGPDPFMFYHFFVGKKAEKMKNIQKTAHTSKTQHLFINIIDTIHKNNYLDNQEVMAYLYGYICHYFLDYYTHPFITYKSGIFKKDQKETYKYNALHQKIEYNIDLYMIKKREKELPYQFKVYKNIFNVKKLSKELKLAIEESYQKTYSYQNIIKKYTTSIHYMKLFFKYINHDKTGIKLKIYQLIDKITTPKIIKLEELSYHHDFEKNLSYLNLEHNPWNYPWDKTKIFHTSFFDLYEEALKKTIETITQVTEILEKEKLDIQELKKIFPNLSYSTGKPCQEKLEMKYFEF